MTIVAAIISMSMVMVGAACSWKCNKVGHAHPQY
jgi:hypothetical protein